MYIYRLVVVTRDARLLPPPLSYAVYTVHNHRIHTIYTVNSHHFPV